MKVLRSRKTESWREATYTEVYINQLDPCKADAFHPPSQTRLLSTPPPESQLPRQVRWSSRHKNKVSSYIDTKISLRLLMAFPHPPGLLPSEVAFLCEMELVTIVPRQRLERLDLLGVR